MCQMVYKISAFVNPAPPRALLAKFLPGPGGLTIEDFRMGSTEFHLQTTLPNIMPFALYRDTIVNCPLVPPDADDTDHSVRVNIDNTLKYPSRKLTHLQAYWPTENETDESPLSKFESGPDCMDI